MRYSPTERTILENALYLTTGQYGFNLPMDTPPHPHEGWKAQRGTRLHQGLDFGAPIGSRVYAAGPGTVTVSRDWGTGTGRWIVIEHDGPLAGFQTRYIHLDQRLVKVGDYVEGGDLIAFSGDTGRALVPHLHFDIQADLAAHPELREIFTKKFIGRGFHGKYNVPGEVLLPLADDERPGLIERVLTGADTALHPTERPYMPPPGIPIIPRAIWIAGTAFGLVAGAVLLRPKAQRRW